MTTLKPSGIAWIGDIPFNWETKRIKHVAQIYTGNSISDDEKEQYEDSANSYPYISSKDIAFGTGVIDYENGMYTHTNDRNFRIAAQGCSLVCIEGGSAGKKIAYLTQDVSFVNKLCCFQAVRILPRFLNFYLLTDSFSEEFRLHISGLIGGVSQGELRNFNIVVPPLSEQQAIAAFLDDRCGQVDSIITDLVRQVEILRQYKKALITETVTKGLDKFAPMKDSGIPWVGNIPDNWSVKRLQSIAYVRARLGWRGLTADEYVDSGYAFLSAFNIIDDILDLSELNYIDKFRYDESPEIKLSEGDILIVKDGAGLGKCARIDELPFEATTNSSLAVISANEQVNYRYLYYFLVSDSFKEFIEIVKNGMGVPHLVQSELRKLLVPLPSITEQEAAIVFLDKKCIEVNALIAEKELSIETMRQYKKSLIYEYVTGKKRVADGGAVS
jgi:type I restriction enzyme S subunit